MSLTRRKTVLALAGVALAPITGPFGRAQAKQGLGQPRHGLSAFGELKYAPTFPHFDYVNPAAPKGGRLTTIGTSALTTFDSFNAFILKGDAAQGLGLLFDTLMIRATDEPDSFYGLVAETVTIATDQLSATFKLRADAKFSDGSPVTADDCVFSFVTLKEKGHPGFRVMMKDVIQAAAVDPRTIKFTFTGTQLRSLPATVASLPVLSKSDFTKRPFEESSLDKPLGSGPYEIADYKQGTFVTYKRRAGYWAKDLAVNRGRHNFDEVRYEYFRERIAGFQALKAGLIDVREEFTSKEWATAYDFPAITENRVLKQILPDRNPSGTQGWWINTRKAKFADIRVRQALDYAFDFEWTNKNVFYGLYQRTTSFFENSAMKADGKPTDAELKLLAPHRDKLRPVVFDVPYVPPVSDGTGNDRRLMREAGRLLQEAGWEIKGGQRVNAKGEAFEIEFLINDPGFERLLSPYVNNLKAIGIAATIRKIDEAQYQRRQKAFDFDILSARFTMGLTPGPELRDYFGSDAAGIEGSKNLAGITDPVVDALVKKIAEADSRADLDLAARALDRVLRSGHYWVPHWYKASHSIALWDKFGRPAIKPAYDRGIIDTWWFDEDKAKRLKQN